MGYFKELHIELLELNISSPRQPLLETESDISELREINDLAFQPGEDSPISNLFLNHQNLLQISAFDHQIKGDNFL